MRVLVGLFVLLGVVFVAEPALANCQQLWSTIQENQRRWSTMGNHPDRKYFAANAQNLINLYNQKCSGGLASSGGGYSSGTSGWDQALGALGIMQNTLNNIGNILAIQEQQQLYQQRQAEIASMQRQIEMERQQEAQRQQKLDAAKRDYAYRQGLKNPFAVTDPCNHLSSRIDSRVDKFCSEIRPGECVPDKFRCVAENSDYYRHFVAAGVKPSDNPFELVPTQEDYERLLDGKSVKPKGNPKVAPKARTFRQDCENHNPFDKEGLRAMGCIK